VDGSIRGLLLLVNGYYDIVQVLLSV